MLLKHTQELMRRKLEAEALDTYAVLVGMNGEEGVLHSENADEDTLFDIASCGKILHTTPLILQAAGEGRLTLDCTLPEFFDNVPTDKQSVTIRQLLTHTSGIIRVPLPKEVCAQGIDATAKYIMEVPLAFPPGEDYVYSCNGMILLGYILEKLYGKTMEALFEDRIKKPLGMTRSCFAIAVDEPNAAVCYTRAECGSLRFDDANVLNMGRVGGSGGSFFTANDIRKYVQAVLARDERLYKKEYFDLAEKDYAPKCAKEGRGLGYLYVDGRYPQTGDLFPNGSFGHTGWTGQSIFMNRAMGLYVVVLTNVTRFTAMKANFANTDYSKTITFREDVHKAIRDDLAEEGFLR